MEQMTHRRTRYLVKRRLQLKYAAILVATMLVVTGICGTGLYFNIWSAVIENFSAISMIQQLENVKRLSAYEQARYGFRSSDSRLTQIFKEAELLSGYQQGQLSHIIKEANGKLLPKLLGLVFLIALASIFISHKIAGPLVRFERSIQAIKSGDLTAGFSIRRNDEMKDLAEDLEEMIASLRQAVAVMKESVAGAQRGAIDGTEAIARIGKELEKYTV